MTASSEVVRPDWRLALNPPIYLVSVLPGLGVPLLANGESLSWAGLFLATVAVVLLQHAINLFNDAADWRLGADVGKLDSWVRVHGGQASAAVVHGVISLCAGGLLGLFVLGWQAQWWLLMIAAPLLLLGYLYNAGARPLSYTHLGEWVTGICYGPGVFGCLWLVAGGPVDARWLSGSIAFAALAMALLLSHQPPQIDTDRAAGKLSFAVRYGAGRTRRVAVGLFGVFVVALVFGALDGPGTGIAPGSALVLAVVAVLVFLRVRRAPPTPKRILLGASAFLLSGLAVNALLS